MKARERDWVMVRLKRDTLAKIRELGEKWFSVYSDGGNVPAPNDRNEISVDKIVQELIRRDNAHREASKRQRDKKAKARGNGDES